MSLQSPLWPPFGRRSNGHKSGSSDPREQEAWVRLTKVRNEKQRERGIFTPRKSTEREKKILIIIKKKRKRREIKQSEVVMFLLWREGVAETPPPLKSIKT